MHELPLLTNLAMALAAALLGGLLARRVGLPPIVGYLIAGVAISPGTPGYRGDPHTISQLAELGIALLMFGVGAHFSIRDLWRVRSIAVPGAILQMAASTGLGYLLGRAWGWTGGASLLLGIAMSIASTIVLVRALMDRGLLDTWQGRIAVGWLVLEDLATVLALVLLPAVVGAGHVDGLGAMAWALGKAALFVALMWVAGVRVVPWLLSRIASTRSRELFVLGALTVALGTALASAAFFGVSIALGAFVAGVVVRESRHGHQVSADVMPFRDAFSVLFFVSVGMLVDLSYVRDHLAEIAALSALVIAGKAILGAGIVLAISRSWRAALTVGAALAQIGEFSFIVGQAGVSLGIVDGEQYSLLLAVAVVSITLNPLAFRIAHWIERRVPAHLGRRTAGETAPGEAAPAPARDGHVVVVGHGRVGRRVVEVLDRMEIPTLVIDNDERRIDAMGGRRVESLYGDAASSEILTHAGLESARALIVALPDPVTTELVVGRAHDLAPGLHVVARADSLEQYDALARAGAAEVVDPQLEGSIELLRRVLLLMEVPVPDVHRHTETLRARDRAAHVGRRRVLDQLVRGARDLELTWIAIGAGCGAAGATLGDIDLRRRTGASCVAIARDEALITNPDGSTRIRAGDELAIIGRPDQIAAAVRFLAGPAETRPVHAPSPGALAPES